jgi:hypothetical protein
MKEINILILCADENSIKNLKTMNIMKQMCDTNVLKCDYWNKIHLYYSGINLSHEILTNLQNSVCIHKNIPIVHTILPDNVANLKNHKLPEYVKTHLHKSNPRFFDIIINEYCPMANHLTWTVQPQDLVVILSTLKKNGLFINPKKLSQKQGYFPIFQSFTKLKTLQINMSPLDLYINQISQKQQSTKQQLYTKLCHLNMNELKDYIKKNKMYEKEPQSQRKERLITARDKQSLITKIIHYL